MGTPNSNRRGSTIEKPKRLTVRDAVFFVLGGLAVAGGAYALFSEPEPVPKPAATSSTPVTGEGEPDRDIPPYQVAIKAKEKIKMAQSAECKPLSLDEMRKRVHEAETQERLELGQAVINRFCIANPEIQEEIIDSMMEGQTNVDEIYKDNDDSWILKLSDSAGRSADHIYLEGPLCNLPEPEEPEKSEEDKILELIKENKFLEALEEIDIDRIKKETSSQGVDQRMVNLFIELIEETKQALRKDISPDEKKMLACSMNVRTIRAAKRIKNREEIDMYKFNQWLMASDSYSSKVFNQFDDAFDPAFKQSTGIKGRSGCERFLYESLEKATNIGGDQQ